MKRFLILSTLLFLFVGCHWACQKTFSLSPSGTTQTAPTPTPSINNNTLGWVLSTSSASFTPRSDQTSLVYNNAMWIIGGVNTTVPTYFNDVWSSTNGSTWAQA